MDFAAYSVLIADEPANAKQTCELLHSMGFRSFYRADNPETALGHIKSQFLTLALVSLQLPPDGADLIQSIRRDLPDPKRRLPILATSSLCDTASVFKARKAGANHVVVRPFTTGNLLRSIEIVLCDTREFIVAPSYIGPDRRVHADASFLGRGRRASDSLPTSSRRQAEHHP
jgi:two-component system, response regulator PdtaR